MSEQLQAVAGGPGTPGHPELEELAALIDGHCGDADAARIRTHLASCEECYEVFSETLHLQEDLREEDPVWLDPLPSENVREGTPPAGGVVVELERRRKTWPMWAAGSLAALVVLGVGIGLWIPMASSPVSDVAQLTAQLTPPLAGQAAGLGLDLQKSAWNEVKRGGGNGKTTPPEELAVQAGVAALNLQLALASNDSAAADNAAAQMCSVLGISREGNQPNGKLVSSQLNFADPAIVDFYGKLRGRLRNPKSLAGEAAKQANALRTALAGTEDYFDLGKWAEAGRFATIARKPAFFAEKTAGSLLGKLQKEAEKDKDAAEIPAEVVQALKTVDALSKARPSDQDYRNLRSALETILGHYYPQGRPYEL
jgi:hypothetical protein